MTDATRAQIRSFGRGWNALVGIGDGFTLMEPFGGATSHGFNATEERLAALARNFRNGTARLEVDQTYASDDMVVLVYVERNDGGAEREVISGQPTAGQSI